MDWSENFSCIKCDKGGDVLLCSENGCPLAVHEGCLGYPARFDDAGRFCCPYCLYKEAVGESRKAREYALARKKALLIFMDGSENDMGENKTCEDSGHNQSKTSGSNVNNASGDNSKSKSNNDGIIDQPFQLGEEDKTSNVEEDSESSAGSKGEDPSLMINGENGDGTVEEKQIEEEEREASVEEEDIQEEELGASAEEENIQERQCEASVQEENIQEEEREASVEEENIQEEERETSVEEENIQEEQREASVKEETIQEEECEKASIEDQNIQEEECEKASIEDQNIQEKDCETSSASTNQDPSPTVHARATRGSKRSKPVDKESEAVTVQSKLLKQHDKKKQASPILTPTRRSTRRSSSTIETGKAVNEEFGSPGPWRLRSSEKPAETPRSSYTFGIGKRRRLMWTEEEEEALRAGVKRYSNEGKIPWRKILEESNEFDETRTPADLKDKWRNKMSMK